MTAPHPTPSQKLSELGVKLPAPPNPVAAYLPAVVHEQTVLVSGQIPMVEGSLKFKGSVPSEVSEADAVRAARHCALNALAVVDSVVPGGLDAVHRAVPGAVVVLHPPRQRIPDLPAGLVQSVPHLGVLRPRDVRVVEGHRFVGGRLARVLGHSDLSLC